MNARGVKIRAEIIKGLLWAIPAGIATYFLTRYVGFYSGYSWRLLAVIAPVALVLFYLGRPLWRERRLVLGGGFRVFSLLYCFAFSVLAGSDLLNGERTVLTGYEESTPSNFLGMSKLGDWHYQLIRDGPPANELVIVSLPPNEDKLVIEARGDLTALIKTAIEKDARGIAFDFFLLVESEADRILCYWVAKADSAGIPVFFGYRVERHEGLLVRKTPPDSLQTCITEEHLASLAGYRESDERIRMVPLFFQGDQSRGGLSYKIARTVADDDLDLPSNNLLQFTEPRGGVYTIDGMPEPDEKELFRDRFVLVGSTREGDRHATPFGELSGVKIHAYAASSLINNYFIRRIDRAWLFPFIFLLCYVVGFLQSSGGGRKRLISGALVLGVTVLASAALAIHLGLLWIDVSYPLIAVGLLTTMLIPGAVDDGGRRPIPDESRSWATVSAPSEHEGFDVFLSHNGEDKPNVRQLTNKLAERGLRPWLDERELPPGKPWLPELEKIIVTVRSAAVLVGKDGIGPWEREEVDALLHQCVKRGIPLIPVLLPGAPSQKPDLPVFVRLRTWVDMRSGLTNEGVSKLEWGITGIKPEGQKKQDRSFH